MIEDRWIAPGSKCDCCGRKRDNEPPFCDDRMVIGGSGFNFNWCPECEKNRQADCGKVMLDCAIAWRKHCEEQWKKKKE